MSDVRLCACGCGTPLVGRTQKQYAGRGHVLRVHGGDGRNNNQARASNAATLARKRIARWSDPYFDAVVRLLGDEDALSRRQLATLRATLAKVARENYDAGYRAGWSTYHQRIKDGRTHLSTPERAA